MPLPLRRFVNSVLAIACVFAISLLLFAFLQTGSASNGGWFGELLGFG